VALVVPALHYLKCDFFNDTNLATFIVRLIKLSCWIVLSGRIAKGNMETEMEQRQHQIKADCMSRNALVVRDALEILNGKWKLPILMALSNGFTRFSEIANALPGITDRVLSKELKQLEATKLLERRVVENPQQRVEYFLTEQGNGLDKVIKELSTWGLTIRKNVMGNNDGQ
jgi:DNA-binding HxlR family transcriptional regulator